MRKYMYPLLKAFVYDDNSYAATAHVENNIFYSYSTPIAVKKNGRYFLTLDKFSTTTSGQQNALLSNLAGCYVSVVPHEEVMSIINGNEPSAKYMPTY